MDSKVSETPKKCDNCSIEINLNVTYVIPNKNNDTCALNINSCEVKEEHRHMLCKDCITKIKN